MKIVRQFLLGMILSLSGAAAWAYCTPLMLDLGRDGFQLGPQGVGVHFDINGDGGPNHIQWVRSGGDEAFIALDRNGDGIVNDGSELFGLGTPLLLEGRRAPNGFVALAQYDSAELGGNGDGFVTEADAIWSQLSVWIDSDANAISEASEMRSLEAAGVSSLEIIPRFLRTLDEAGNLLPWWATAQSEGGDVQMVDVYFVALP